MSRWTERRRLRYGALAYAALGAPGLVFALWTTAGATQDRALELAAASIETEIGVRLSALDSMMSTVAGVGAGGSEIDGGLGPLVARLIEQQSSLNTIGRYAHVEPRRRDEFVASMAERGLYRFEITRIDESGRPRPIRDGRQGYPIRSIEPMTPTNAVLLGADLAALPGLGRRLSAAVPDDAPVLARLPESWPGAEQLLYLRPAYRGNRAPENEIERVRQSDGGYWALIDPHRLMSSVGAQAGTFDLRLRLGPSRRPDGPGATIATRPPDRDPLWRAGYEPRARVLSWTVGDSTLELELVAERGLLAADIAAGAAIVGVTSAVVLCLLLLVGSRAAQRDAEVRHLQRLSDARAQAARAVHALGDAVLGLSPDGVVRSANPAAERLLGVRSERLIGEHVRAALPLRDRRSQPFVVSHALEVLERGEPVELDLYPVVDAGERVFRAALTLADGGADDEHLILLLRDVSDERRALRELAWQANHDALTGATNRHYFAQRLQVLNGRSEGAGHALLYIDLDQFKVINDTSGHDVGDKLLKGLARRLSAAMRSQDVLSRIGGDEFGVLLMDVDRVEARAIAERLHETISAVRFKHAGRSFPLRASLGLVHVEDSDGTDEDLLALADIAVYEAKAVGRNALRVYSRNDEHIVARSHELACLPQPHKALDEDAFRLHLQPIAAIGECGTHLVIERFECLLRLTDEDGREVTPWRIIQAAERYGSMRDVDRHVIELAVSMVAEHHADLPESVSFSVNLSGLSAGDPELVGHVKRALGRHGVPGSRFGFEITETAAINDLATAVEQARRIRELGAYVALDDFGAGLSGFGLLKSLPIDVVKIDGQFVRALASDPVDRAMVASVAEVARAMGVLTVAEFVEDQATLEILAELGIDFAQGYHIARPQPVEQALGRIRVTSAPTLRRATPRPDRSAPARAPTSARDEPVAPRTRPPIRTGGGRDAAGRRRGGTSRARRGKAVVSGAPIRRLCRIGSTRTARSFSPFVGRAPCTVVARTRGGPFFARRSDGAPWVSSLPGSGRYRCRPIDSDRCRPVGSESPPARRSCRSNTVSTL